MRAFTRCDFYARLFSHTCTQTSVDATQPLCRAVWRNPTSTVFLLSRLVHNRPTCLPSPKGTDSRKQATHDRTAQRHHGHIFATSHATCAVLKERALRTRRPPKSGFPLFKKCPNFHCQRRNELPWMVASGCEHYDNVSQHADTISVLRW